MDLTILGSGSAIQFEKRASASFLLETGGKKIVLDAGFYLLDRLERAGVMADEIDAVYISHKHPDHFIGLIHLLFALKNQYYKPKEELLIFGFKGLKEWFGKFQQIMGRWVTPDTRLIFCDDTEGENDYFQWEIFKTEHSPESTGIIIKAENRKILYTGDTEYFEKLPIYAKGCDLMIAECGSGNDCINRGHMNMNDLKMIAESSTVKLILATHIYPETDQAVKSLFHNDTEIRLTDDLHKISL